jgi:hypothetical protein
MRKLYLIEFPRFLVAESQSKRNRETTTTTTTTRTTPLRLLQHCYYYLIELIYWCTDMTIEVTNRNDEIELLGFEQQDEEQPSTSSSSSLPCAEDTTKQVHVRNNPLVEPPNGGVQHPISLLSREELMEVLSERHVLNLSPEEDELLDPIERTIRYIIPIPKYYYWDIVLAASNRDHDATTTTSTSSTTTTDDIPLSIKSWHTIIGWCDHIGTWTNHRVAQPIASFLGLTGPRFHEVINSMSPEEFQQSVHVVRERQLRGL